MQYIRFKNFNLENQHNRYFATIGENEYSFVVYWDEYCDCAFLSIYDYYNNPIITGRALTNNLVIRNNKLPSVFYFAHLDGEFYEPTLDIISKEYGLYYGDVDNEE